MSTETWYAAFAYHSEYAWTELMAGELHDLAEAVRRLGCEVRVTREWQRGPHLRLGVRGSACAAARALLDDGLATILRTRPARLTIDLAEVRSRAERLARTSGDVLQSDWLTNNTVSWSGPSPVGPAEDLPGLVEAFHFKASLPALRMLAEPSSEQQRVLQLCELMAATAERYGRNGLLMASSSFRSHAEAHLALEAAPGTRAVWDEEAARSAPALRERLFAIARGDVVPARVQEWLDILDPLIDRASALHGAGALILPTAEDGFDAELTGRSRFHRDVSERDDWRALVSSEWFVLYRVAVSLLYLQFSRLGVRPAARFRLCHLVASAVRSEPSTIVTKEPRP